MADRRTLLAGTETLSRNRSTGTDVAPATPQWVPEDDVLRPGKQPARATSLCLITLNKIAPTVAYPRVPFGTPWEETTRLIGQILGKAATAESLVNETIAMVETPSPFVRSLLVGDVQTAFHVDISPEQFGAIDADILILWLGTQDQADAKRCRPCRRIPAMRDGAYAPIIGETNVMAVSAPSPSPLSTPYIIDTYVPELAAAADKVPA